MMKFVNKKTTKILNIFLCFCLIFLAVFFAGCDNSEESKSTITTVRVLGLGDSISAGYAPQNTELYSHYNDYVSNRTDINLMCYTNLVANGFVTEQTKVVAKSYAESGDKTSDLVKKLNDEKTYPDILNDVKRADIITLCIGANNVLTPAINNLSAYISGDVTLDDIRTELQTGFEQFRDNYTNTIIDVLTRGKGIVLVMTIFDPYKYFDLTEANISSAMASTLQEVNQKFQEVKSLAIEYLDEINNYIKTEKYEKVFVVDVHTAFESISKNDYPNYINANSKKITMSDLMNLQTSVNVDPHPTLNGQKFIASLFKQKIESVLNIKLSSQEVE